MSRSRWLHDLFVPTIFLIVVRLAVAQFPPPPADDDSIVLQSPVNGNVTITYKSPPIGTCTTVFATQKQYTGYITLPPNVLDPSQDNYTINTFFWFIEARQVPDSAPLTIFLNGGPGSSSMVGLFQEVGPCQVVEISKGELGTIAREWGWDRSSNILFIDQPVQVGFSYDGLTNASLNLLNELVTIPPAPVPITQPSYTFLNGTFGSTNPMFTANTSQMAAQSLWHFLQTFLAAFPEYNTANRDGVATINLFTESYGGKYGPTVASFFQTQNRRRQTDATFANHTIDIALHSLGIMNGWIDLLTQAPYQPRFAYQNSYGIQALSQVQELNALSAYSAADGCQQLTATCRAREAAWDPHGAGNVTFVNDACSQAQAYCENYVTAPYTSSGRSIYDISQDVLNPFPDSHYLEYLNRVSVQKAIGVPVNYTQDSAAVAAAFNATGDYARNGIIADLVDLLNGGVRVALIYGDRDYICNWLGGEAASFAIAGAAGPSYLPWYAAGYAPIVTNSSYIGGVVREYGNLSFSRIFDAGHLVPAYQPETAFTVFSRIIQGTDVSLGNAANLATYRSSGNANSTHENIPPPVASPTCFLRAVNATCNTDQKNMLANRAGVIINGVLYSSEGDWHSPDPSLTTMAGLPGTPPVSVTTSAPMTTSSTRQTTKSNRTSSDLPTGVYTATGVPKVTSSSTKSQAKSNLLRDTQPAIALGLFSFGVLCG